MSRRAFTLIELLVVLAILGLLAAVLFPVFAHVRENGRRTACLSNLHQLELAMQMYSHDSDDTLPSGTHMGGTTLVGVPEDSTSGTGMGWAGEVYPYVKDTAVFTCPDDTPLTSHNKYFREVIDGVKVSPTGTLVSYGYNSLLVAEPFIGTIKVGNVDGKVDRLPHPADTVMLFEITGDAVDITHPDEGASQGVMLFSAAGDGANLGAVISPDMHDKLIHCLVVQGLFYATGRFVGSGDRPPGDPDGGSGDFFPNPVGRHSGGSNFLLADGHAKWVPPGRACSVGLPVGHAEAECAVHFWAGE